MKKKNMQRSILIYICILLVGALGTAYQSPTSANGNETVTIPDDAIRLRILANSDSKEDQQLKRKIRDQVNEEINVWVEKLTSVEEAHKLIEEKLVDIEKIVEETMIEESNIQSYSVSFKRVEFPTKLYGNYLYPAGTYQALLISLGEAEGANWWCVLFPPLCFLDFSNGEAVEEEEEAKKKEEKEDNDQLATLLEEIEKPKKEEEEDKVEVKFFLVEWFEGLFS
ncbi:stage II sporulation protein R [Bacillus carboniphilus]|uniref:Stage II sporulation protein R n=1 Tax=Bacillus carboniphilus TaxID=86663 RepID=A0ABY9JSF0_9BACI|nr:stage II sporulation protein R [Bacillus carboniphilus]WLR41663.1 stage II sporulation protein R [Bacillus carboniphilus]